MSQIGTLVLTAETPPAVANSNNTANAFMLGLTDWGPAASVGGQTVYTSLSQLATTLFGPNGGLLQNSRNSGNSTIYDSADAYFREGGGTVYVARVVGPASVTTLGTLNLSNGASVAATLNAAYVGTGSSFINAVVTNGIGGSASAYTVTLQDANGSLLSVSPTLAGSVANRSDLITWAATTNLVTAASGTSNASPAAVGTIGAVATNPLSAGNDGRASATVTHWTNAANSGFPSSLGPGQVMAPNQNNTTLSGIWSGLATHAQNTNRVALLDGTDGNTATQAIAEITNAAIPSSLQSYCGLWVGNLQIPGITAGTARVIAPSPVVAALCARADALGDPNLAAAGLGFPLQYVSGVNTQYFDSLAGDIATLNSSGANVFSVQYNVLQNFGFVSLVALPTNDQIYWQYNHGRMRMAITYQSQITAQPYQFAQLDGQGQTLAAFAGSLQGMLLQFYNAGALFGATPSDAFIVNVGTTVNTTSTLANGNLIAYIAVRMSPFAQLVTITVNAVPITQSLPNSSSTGSTL